jgi:hypothetical protein
MQLVLGIIKINRPLFSMTPATLASLVSSWIRWTTFSSETVHTHAPVVLAHERRVLDIPLEERPQSRTSELQAWESGSPSLSPTIQGEQASSSSPSVSASPSVSPSVVPGASPSAGPSVAPSVGPSAWSTTVPSASPLVAQRCY